MLVPGASSQALAAALADELGESLAAVEYDRFPDGETLAAVPGFDADAATIVASTASNDAYVELLQLQDAVREAGASAVTTVIPYMGYARQDKAFEAGHPVSARAVARAVSTTTDRVVLVNPHEDAVSEFFDAPVDIVDAAGRLAEPLPELDAPLFLSPDSGAIDIAETVRDAYGEGETDYFEKVRHSGTDVDITPSDADFAGRDVVITDDIIATGSTMSEAVGVLTDGGAKRVFCATVHPLLARNARTKLARAGIERVVGTDTIERDVSEVSVAPALATELER
ncbi:MULTISPECIES: ribose-phosphate diphosphokinase [unclassified Haloferax]|uniref:ribose-phosphate diphosphokinase n=1 Tax=unclassified Haloferax TaxID=2625095 RepID=UPI0002B116B7|nr:MULTISPECIES: ribose-phosphate diphosphokinase [unclassified Haloferax]ELZ57892.1 ribose-phosphate pyrophosphokinase [Haloferax sp. ATCC BAA-646]ELZ62377.1 ribose-phosphate pyrophosphokinase [Haloferax sp. ATCC BAA-645]ELZ64136.1 ribose-phosphate pyrophosphokinase [Haloferax sp. ATCC BAA-644]